MGKKQVAVGLCKRMMRTVCPFQRGRRLDALGTSPLVLNTTVLHCNIAPFVPGMGYTSRSESQNTVLVLTRPHSSHSWQRILFFFSSFILGSGLHRSIAPAPPCVDHRRYFLCFTHKDRSHRSGDALSAGITRGQRVDDRANITFKNEQYGYRQHEFCKPHGAHATVPYPRAKLELFRKFSGRPIQNQSTCQASCILVRSVT